MPGEIHRGRRIVGMRHVSRAMSQTGFGHASKVSLNACPNSNNWVSAQARLGVITTVFNPATVWRSKCKGT